MKTILTILLCSSLAVNAPCQEKPNPAAAGVGVAIVVICVGSYCVYKVAKFCQKHFPKKPANTNELYSVSGGVGDDEYGGSWNYGALGSCLMPQSATATLAPDSESRPTTFALNVFVASPSSLVTTMSAASGLDSWQTWPQFQAEVASHGLTVTGVADGSMFFERERQAARAEDVPIRFGPEPGQVTVGEGELVRIVVERSTNLESWETMLVTQYPVGQRLEILDTSTEESAFYRASVVP